MSKVKMKVKNKKIIFICSIMICFMANLTSCFNYRDINKVIFATAVIYDRSDDGVIKVYYDCIKPFRSSSDSSEKGKRQVYEGEGSTVLQAIQRINMSTSHDVNFSQCTTYIFTEKAAINGIKPYIDVMNREQEFAKRPVLFVYFGDLEELLSNVSEDEESVGSYVSDLVNKTKRTPASLVISFNEYLTQRTMDYANIMVGALTTKQDLDGTRMQLNGGCVFNNDQLKQKIDENDIIVYKFLNDNVSSGIYIVDNPISNQEKVTLEIIESNTNTDVQYENNNINLNKNIWIRAGIGETDGKFNGDRQVVDLIAKKTEEKMKKDFENMYAKYKEENLDIFGVNKMVNRKYKESVLGYNPIKDTNLNISLKVEISGTGVVQSSF